MRNIQLQQFVNYFRHCDTIHQHYDFGVKTLVGQDRSTIWKLINKLREEDMEERALERSFAQGNVVRKRVRDQTQRLHNRLLNLCQRCIEIVTSSWMIFSKPQAEILEWIYPRSRNDTSTT